VRLRDERTGTTHDYRAKAGRVVDAGTVNWNGTRDELWNAAECAEVRRDAVVAREVLLALPRELDDRARSRLVGNFAAFVVLEHGTAVDWALHAPTGTTGENHHAHVLITARTSDGNTLGAKTRELDVSTSARGHVEAWRGKWAALVTEELKRAGYHQVQLDHRSYARRAQEDGGPEGEPQPRRPFGIARDPAALGAVLRAERTRRELNARIAEWRAASRQIGYNVSHEIGQLGNLITDTRTKEPWHR